jgi:AraC-like DNA-binding protein
MAAVAPAAPGRALRLSRHESDEGLWELVEAAPAPRLAGFVRSYVGYHERTHVAARRERRELPGPVIVFILELGPTLRLSDARGRAHPAHPGGFVAGLDEAFTTTHLGGGEQRGIQIDCSLDGAAALLGVPLGELAGQIVGVRELFGAQVVELRERILATSDWRARFELLDRFLLARLDARSPRAAAPGAHDWLAVACQRILASGGGVSVDALARALGYSRKHLTVSFRARYGLPPKPLARLVRFDRAVQALRAGPVRDLAQLGLACGYFDQAHFIRDFRRYAGTTPGDFQLPWPADPNAADAAAR